MSQIHVKQQTENWILKNSNVKRFGIIQDKRGPNSSSFLTIHQKKLSIKVKYIIKL